MTIEETKKLITVMIASYPNYKPESMQMTLSVWKEMLAEYDYRTVAVALKTYIATDKSGFAPSIGQIINCISKLTFPEHMNETEAWALVREAISNGGYHSREEFEKLPPIIQKIVGSPNQIYTWAMDEFFNESVTSSNFMRAYRMECQRQDEYNRMPKEARAMIEAVSKGVSIDAKTRVLLTES